VVADKRRDLPKETPSASHGMPHSLCGRHIANQLVAEIGPLLCFARNAEVDMTNRPTRFLRAIFTGVIACTSIATIPVNAEAAPGVCLVAKPKNAAPPGQFWLHLNDWATNRHCWVLRARVETTSQAKGATAVQAARPATHATGAPPARTPEGAATNEAATRTGSSQQKDDGKAASGAGAAPEHADQSLSYAEHSDTARLPPLASGPLEATDARATASGPTSTLAFAVRTQEINRVANPPTDPHAGIEASSAPAPSVAKTTTETHEIAASHFLELMLSAIFFGPALYLLAARAVRRVADPSRRPLPYTSLSDASAERTLLPPPRESAASS
jgi:hypothetical protein